MSVNPLQARLRLVRSSDNDAGVSLTELVIAMGLSVLISGLTLAFFLGTNSSSTQGINSNIANSAARGALDAWTQLIRIADYPEVGTRTSVTVNGVSQQLPQDVDARVAGTNPQTNVGSNGAVPRLVFLDATNLVFYANISNRVTAGAPTSTTKIWLSCSAGSLIERQYSDTGGYDAYGLLDKSSYVVQRFVASNVTLGDGLPCGTPSSTKALFTAYDSTGAVLAYSDQTSNVGAIKVADTACNSGDTSTGFCGSPLSQSLYPQAPVASIRITFTATVAKSDPSTTAQAYESTAAIIGGLS